MWYAWLINLRMKDTYFVIFMKFFAVILRFQ